MISLKIQSRIEHRIIRGNQRGAERGNKVTKLPAALGLTSAFVYISPRYFLMRVGGREGDTRVRNRKEFERDRQTPFIVRAEGLITYERSGETKSIRNGSGPSKREVFHFSNSGRALAGHLEEISSVLAGTFLESAAVGKPHRKPVRNFVHFTYRDKSNVLRNRLSP